SRCCSSPAGRYRSASIPPSTTKRTWPSPRSFLDKAVVPQRIIRVAFMRHRADQHLRQAVRSNERGRTPFCPVYVPLMASSLSSKPMMRLPTPIATIQCLSNPGSLNFLLHLIHLPEAHIIGL